MLTKSEEVTNSKWTISWRQRVMASVLVTALIVGAVTLLSKGQMEDRRGPSVFLHKYVYGRAPVSVRAKQEVLLGEKAPAHISVDADVRDGHQAGLSDYPFMALLCEKPAEDGATPFCFCGAVIIDGAKFVPDTSFNKKYLLTAAHCLYTSQGHLRSSSSIEVYMGFVDKRLLPDKRKRTVGFAVKYKIGLKRIRGFAIHPAYHRTGPGAPDDIAVLKLADGMYWGEAKSKSGFDYGAVGPINLVDEAKTFPEFPRGDTNMKIMGWGYLKPPSAGEGSPASDVLRWADVPVLNRDTCRASFSDLLPLGNPINTFCAGGPRTGESFPVVCQGDSGGPIVRQNPDGTYTLWGIVKTAVTSQMPPYKCQGEPALFTAIVPYIPWIRLVLKWYKADDMLVPIPQPPPRPVVGA